MLVLIMRAMRDSAKWVMLILAIAFVGWLVLDWVEARFGAGGTDPNPVVGKVAGHDIRLADWNRYLENQLATARQRTGGSLTEEQGRRVRESAWDQLVIEIVIQAELDRLGIDVTDAEVRQAFQTSPPPEFLSHPAFQTDGEFDYEKYRQYFASPNVDENLLLQMEAYYRNTLPRAKLERVVSAGVYVTENEAWRHFRDRNETARVRYVSVDPRQAVSDADIQVGADEVRAYYRERRDEFSRPATATVSLVSLSTGPSAADSAAARAVADSLRQAIVGGERSFEDVAREVSADSVSAERGGDVGRVGRGDLVPSVDSVVFSLPEGRVSEPVESPFGLHLVEVTSRSGDSASVRHVLVPLEVSAATEDSLFDLIDRLEDIALRTDLATAADSVGLPARTDVVLTKDAEFVPGAGTLGVGVDWAFDGETQVGDLSPFFENASGFHVLELQERQQAGTYPLEEVEADVRARLAAEKKKEVARERLREAATALEGGASLEAVAAERGWELQESRPFTRLDFVPGLGQGTEAIGKAFGLPVGTVSGVVDAGERVAILEVLERTPVDRARFEEIRDQLRQQLMLQRRQEYLGQWIQALREKAEVRDLRDQVLTRRAS